MAGALHILDEEGNEVAPGEAGEIYFDTASSFEYLNDPAKTAAGTSRQGWRTVGDIGYVDDDGYLYLTDRRHHMIISGGVNIYPQEAENVLVTHPRVMDAAVFGIPDDEFGQSVKGVVQLVDHAEAGDAVAGELLEWLRERLSHYKCPRSISFEEALPRTDTGKLYKQSLIEKYSAAAK
jgi:fatty-acyl-CoA synthase